MTLLIFPVAIFFAYLALSVGKVLLSRSTLLHGPVFVPSTHAMQHTMCKLSALKPNQLAIDLGSGDGSLVIALANAYPKNSIVGIEINPLLVLQSRKKIREVGLDHRISILASSMWNIDLQTYDVVLIYGAQQIMPKLEKKVRAEMKPGSKIVSSVFTFPTLTPTRTTECVYQYVLH